MALPKIVRLVAAVALLLAVAAGTFFAWPRQSNRKTASPVRLTIHFTCDTAGRLEPCGCFTGQHGGLTRLGTWLESRENAGPVLNLDVGGAIAGKADHDIIQYRYLAEAYESMGYAALNMGGRESALSATALASLGAASKVPLISASLVNSTTRKEVLEPYRIVAVGGKRIGILGVVSPRSVPVPGENLAVLGLNEAVDRQLPGLAAKCDLVILLAFADESEMRRLARDYFEFALVLGGDVKGPAQEIARENDSIILFTTNKARTVGTLAATLGGDKRLRLLDPEYEIQLLWEQIPQDKELLELVRGYRSEIRRTPLAVDNPHAASADAIPGVAATATYVGSESCRGCHQQAYDIWSKSGHSHAFKTLVTKGADADPHCIGCHTVGFGKESGYRRPLEGKSLVEVGCESCHGPGSEHLAKHLNGKPTPFKFRPIGPGDCTQCHYGEFSREFDWNKFWPGIAHGKEPTTIK